MSRGIDFNEVYEEFKPKVLLYISRLTNSHDAEDIMQEVFQKISRGLEGFQEKSKLSTWIYRIATNTALDKLRSPSSKLSSEEYTDETEDRNVWIGSSKVPVDQSLVRKEMGECVREYVDKLPPYYKTVIVLSELEGFKNKEIADILQVSLYTVKIRLHRARASLKKELDTGCDFYHSEQDILSCDRKPIPVKFKHQKKSDQS
jgi:RNA polymerase sigma-70 factor (ECF subfamily)